jgi:hypothetical protein
MTADTIQGGGGKHYTLENSVAQVRALTVNTGVQVSGQITVTTAGTEVQGPDIAGSNGFYVKALAGNTGVVYVGNNGAGVVSSTTGFQLDKSNVILIQVENLNELWFDAATSGDKLCWLKA